MDDIHRNEMSLQIVIEDFQFSCFEFVVVQNMNIVYKEHPYLLLVMAVAVTLTTCIFMRSLSGAAPQTAQRQRAPLPAPLPHAAQTPALRRSA